jgi:hypothetical protein
MQSTTQIINGKKQYVMFDADHLNDDIWYWENVASYPQELLYFIEQLDQVELAHSKIEPWKPWTASDDASLVYGDVKAFHPPRLDEDSKDPRVNQMTRYIMNSFLMAFEMCFDRYFAGHNLDKNNYTMDFNWLNLKRWNVGQNMGPHFDGYVNDGKKVAFTAIFYLNDDYTGGELYFKDYEKSLKPKAGSMVIFPGSFIHEVKEIKEKQRYMLSISAYTNA